MLHARLRGFPVPFSSVEAGKECSYNYGPKELLEWDLATRRKYLSEKNGFVCRCERCREEAEKV